MHKYVIVPILFLIGLNSYSQIAVVKPFDFSFQKKWVYFDLKKVTHATVITFKPVDINCGVNSTASVTIAKLKSGDIIRVLVMCDQTASVAFGERIKISPELKPTFEFTPFTLVKNSVSNIFESQSYDTTVIRTTWGKISFK